MDIKKFLEQRGRKIPYPSNVFPMLKTKQPGAFGGSGLFMLFTKPTIISIKKMPKPALNYNLLELRYFYKKYNTFSIK